MALIKINSLSNSSLNRRAPYLAALGPDINKILEIAEKKRDTAYYHYVKAVYASQHMAYDTALGEIEKSIRLEPNSARYLLNKGQILMSKGIWNDISNEYRKLCDCDKSLYAAEQALKVMEFGAAKNQKHSAELCIEMQQIVDGTVINTI